MFDLDNPRRHDRRQLRRALRASGRTRCSARRSERVNGETGDARSFLHPSAHAAAAEPRSDETSQDPVERTTAPKVFRRIAPSRHGVTLAT